MPKHSDKSTKATRATRLKRTNASCDTCKGRKTKCIDPVPGPCKYCVSVSSPCTITIKRKQRPFYLVSEDEYRYGIKILQKFFPDTELNLETLQDLARSLDCDGDNATQMASPAIQTSGQGHLNEDITEVAASTHGAPNPSGLSSTTTVVNDDLAHRGDPLTQLLTRQKGSLIIDSLGVTRYVGPRSDLFFISAVRSRAQGDVQQPSVGRIQHPMKHLPPASPESRTSITVPSRPTYLPPRQEWGRHVDRYFSEVNSTYWLISFESLCSRLDTTYAAQNLHDVSASWLCFLYAVLALTSQTAGQDVRDDTIAAVPMPSSRGANECLTCDDYISMAKSLIKDVMDEASLDGVRALSAMSIYTHNQGFAVSSYLTTGTAVRIVYSLGLHQPQAYNEMTTLQRENALRIAWTLYQLDCEISRPSGRPCNTDGASWNPVAPSDMAMSSGIYDPWGLSQFSISLNLEDHNVFQKFSKLSSLSIQKTAQHEVESCTISLQKWYGNVPQHLQWNTPVAPPHQRPICRLHLRYFNIIIFSTRLALLADVSSDQEDFKLSSLGQLCLDACKKSLSILDLMQSSNNLSALTVVDTKFIIDVAMVFLLVLTRWQDAPLQNFLDRCTELLQGMDDVGFCKFAKRDLAMVVEMYNARYRSAHGSAEVPTDQEWTNYQPHFADFNMDIPWHQDPLMASMGWGFFPWEISSGTGNSMLHGP